MSASKNTIKEQVIEVVALALCCSLDGKYLLARRHPGGSGAGHWEFPGGKIEAGETQQQALCREIIEELAFYLSTFKINFIGQNRHHYLGRNLLIYLWRAQVDYRPEFKLVDHDIAQWFSVGEMAEINLSEGDKYFISLI